MPLLIAVCGGPRGGFARRGGPHPPSDGRAFGLGLATGATAFAGLLYWIPDVLVTYGDLPYVAAVGAGLLLVAYLALFPAAFAVVVARALDRLGFAALLAAPMVWVATEVARTHLLSGFPWELLGYSQSAVLPVAQLASVAGVYGLSGLVALGNGAVAYAAVGAPRWGVVLGIVIAAIGGIGAWGAWRLADGTLARAGTPLRVGVVQPSVPQTEKWDPTRREAIVERLATLSRQAATAGARFIVWPESAVPFYVEQDLVGREQIRRLASETGAYLLLGGDQIESGSPARYYNAAFLVTPAGGIGAIYRKIHLVPFGEYVPLRSLLFFVNPLVETVADFSPGTGRVLLPVGDRRASTAICYEVIYPGLIAEFVDRGSELLTTITNDAWYGWSSAPYQHFQQAVLRAIEQGRYLVRAANTGVSAIVDPYGRVVAQSALFETTVLVGDVRWIRSRTVYGRLGDVFAWASVAATVLVLVARRPR